MKKNFSTSKEGGGLIDHNGSLPDKKYSHDYISEVKKKAQNLRREIGNNYKFSKEKIKGVYLAQFLNNLEQQIKKLEKPQSEQDKSKIVSEMMGLMQDLEDWKRFKDNIG